MRGRSDGMSHCCAFSILDALLDKRTFSGTIVTVQKLRGRWSCLDGFTTFGWSGSAVIGGYILDRHGFSVVFFITAAMQFLATAFVVPLLAVVPARELSHLTSPDAGVRLSPETCADCDAAECLRGVAGVRGRESRERERGAGLAPVPVAKRMPRMHDGEDGARRSHSGDGGRGAANGERVCGVGDAE
jgi:hypothetical protein